MTESLSLPGAPPPGEVHLWTVRLEPTGRVLAAAREVLAPDEIDRADRFAFERDRHRFVLARAALRGLIARHLAVTPRAVGFGYTVAGKPFLVPSSELTFNLSHSGAVALIAVARGLELGVDLERVRPDFAAGEIAERFFSARERAQLAAVPPERRPRAFFDCWARKEAVLKGVGLGLGIDLDAFDVAFGPGAPAALLASRHPLVDARAWAVRAVEAPPGYAAAVAVAAPAGRFVLVGPREADVGRLVAGADRIEEARDARAVAG